ncbi:hypothetical protein [Natrinema sp. 74]|uniref:hypothetical protein n=1 Tax=Natrinema sp. 74 TaxID=3384159 RepID=UPI0038D4669F
MTALPPLPDDRPTASRLLVALVFAVVVAGVLVTPVTAASVSTVQDGTGDVQITRNGNSITIDVTDLEDPPDEVTVTVTDPNSSTSVSVNVSDGAGDVAVEKLVSGVADGKSLLDATVAVTAGEVTDEETLDLHTVAFDTNVPVRIEDGSQIVVPFNRSETNGITDNTTVEVTVDNTDLEGGTIRANGTQLVIDQSAVTTVVDTAEFDLKAAIGDDPTQTTTVPLGPDLRDVGDQPVLWHPLLETGTVYDLSIEDGRGRQYVNNSVEPVRAGEIELSPLSGANTVTASVSSAEGVLLDDQDLFLGAPYHLSATVVDDGAAVTFDESVDGLGVSTLIVNSSANGIRQYEFEDGTTIENGRLALESTTVTAADELVVATDAGIAQVTLTSAKSTSKDSDGGGLIEALVDTGKHASPLFLPALVGLLVGYGSYRLRNEWTRNRLRISATISIVLAVATVVGLLYLLRGVPAILTLLSFGGNVAGVPLEVALWPHGLAISGVLLGATLAPGTYYLLGFSAGVDRNTGFTVDVTVTDGNQPLSGRTKIGYRRVDDTSADANKVTISDGVGRLRVPKQGTWNIAAKHGSHDSDVVKVSKRKTSATLTVSFPATVTVTDRTDGEPIDGAAITRMDNGSTETADATGTVTLEPEEPGSRVEIELTHEKYEDRTETIEFTQNGDRTVKLAPRTGRVRLLSRVDGVQTPSMPLRLSPRETVVQDRYGTISMTSDRDALATCEGLLIGQYRADIDAPDGRDHLFDGGKSILTVREDRSTKVEVDARFTWSLSSTHQDQIDRLRRKVRSLSDHSGRDTTIPRYYGSVVLAILETVESLPAAGHHFAHSEAEPDAVADALLAAAESAIGAINDAMTTKRNVDLFAACADMPDPDVAWDGDCELETVLEWLESDAMTQRNELKSRYETVTSQVETERESVSEAAPAEEMLRRAWALGSDAGRGTEAIVTIYAALLLLEAVEDVFEHDPLRDRLSRTVF